MQKWQLSLHKFNKFHFAKNIFQKEKDEKSTNRTKFSTVLNFFHGGGGGEAD